MRGKNYIPRNDAEFDAFFKNSIIYAGMKIAGTPPEGTPILQEDFREL
jgi:hypothetical protein